MSTFGFIGTTRPITNRSTKLYRIAELPKQIPCPIYKPIGDPRASILLHSCLPLWLLAIHIKYTTHLHYNVPFITTANDPLSREITYRLLGSIVIISKPAMEKPAIKMRSSIACTRCRKSKVKCLNNGVNTPCRACESARRECTYPPPSTPGSRNTGINNNTTPVRDSVHAGVGLAASAPDVRNDKPTIQRLNAQIGPGGSSGIQSAANINIASPSSTTEVRDLRNDLENCIC